MSDRNPDASGEPGREKDRGGADSRPEQDETDDYHLYAVTVRCTGCDKVTQFVVTTESEVGLMQDIPVMKSHCPECGVCVDAMDGWDLQAEHKIETVVSER